MEAKTTFHRHARFQHFFKKDKNLHINVFPQLIIEAKTVTKQSETVIDHIFESFFNSLQTGIKDLSQLMIIEFLSDLDS